MLCNIQRTSMVHNKYGVLLMNLWVGWVILLIWTGLDEAPLWVSSQLQVGEMTSPILGGLSHMSEAWARILVAIQPAPGGSSSSRLAQAWPDSKRESGSMQGVLKSRSAMCKMQLLPHSVVSSSHRMNPYSRKWKRQILPLDKRSCKITVQRVWIQGRGSHVGAGPQQGLCAICGKVRPWMSAVCFEYLLLYQW